MIISGANVATPSQAVARDTRALIGGIAGIAAAAIIANRMARAQSNRSGRVVQYRNRAPKAKAPVAQRRQATSDPFAGVTASKVR